MKKKRFLKGLLYFFSGGLLSLILLGAAAFFSNRNLPSGPTVSDRLDSMDKIRLAETLHLKTVLGEEVWPGLGDMQFPILLWHQHNSFLIGVDAPPPGWQKVSGDLFQGEPYFQNPTIDPENFAMRIGGQWVASMGTKGETDLFIEGMFREIIPDPLEPFFPFRLLILNSEIQISGVLHEALHVVHANTAPGKFAQADAAFQDLGSYWKVDPEMRAAWRDEMNLLIEAVQAEGGEKTRKLAQQFLAGRDQRRADHHLAPELVRLEQQAEWLEGVAKYVELSIWEAAATNPGYNPIPEILSDPDFKEYQTFNRRWSQEISQARRQATLEGDVRFYYSGMLQARLLDKLAPGWKEEIMAEGVFLDDLLRATLTP